MKPLQGELWKDTRYPPYKVSSQGRIMGQLRRIMRPRLRNGTEKVHFTVNGRVKEIGIHRLVATAFIGPDLAGYRVKHKDNNRMNNQVENLEYVELGGK